ncbi:cation diffusion facilitator family transporter [Thiomicrorhabdus sp. ZW0627]|uniref:cation diffusion facilitator family transporter n=1 Tax=Thiomicrorhabdus sp. ZW0627 TaxID=3039774 RepID=UPI0024368CAD|nr:cation diffusion facilitator family transporter [Thiomicrorhabdus sp. ZW0627]MDG6774252.1 cation diffusion facilitator family transporter [Thiomicrorhabdus sp. ZW0627]
MIKSRLVRIATYVSVAVAVSLVMLKIYAWWQTGSVSILASLLDSALDIAASVMIAVAVHIAQTPPDKEHRFGHGKAEPLASLAQSVFIAGSAGYLILYSLDRLFGGSALKASETGLVIMLISLIMTLGLIAFQRYVIHKTHSTAIKADSLHYMTDVLANILVIVSLWLSHIQWLDPLLALGIAVWILRSAIAIAKDAGNQLLDRELPEEMRQQIQQIILGIPKVRGFNDLRTYQSGPNFFVQLDLELDDELTLRESHRIAEQVTKALTDEFENLDVIIHQEPVSLKNDPQHHTWGEE